MHAPAANLPAVSTWRHPNGDGTHYFDSTQAAQWIQSFNATGNTEALERLLEHVTPLARSILEYRCTTKYEMLDELLSMVHVKLWRSLRLYDAARGSAYSFCAMIISRTAASAVNKAWTRSERFCALEEPDTFRAPATNATAEAITDLVERIRCGIKTTATELNELDAQRWYFQSLVSAEFAIRRHEAANAAMQVYGLRHARSRWLYDTVILEARRVLIGDRRVRTVSPHSLRNTRLAGIVRYAGFLSPTDFSRLAALLKDLPPALVAFARVENFSKVRAGDVEATQENLRLILDGDPAARPLFIEELRANSRGTHAV
jgi:DNA-directed RNA polymerase specialized sigma24 family protein